MAITLWARKVCRIAWNISPLNAFTSKPAISAANVEASFLISMAAFSALLQAAEGLYG
jgi:hypothetical protein